MGWMTIGKEKKSNNNYWGDEPQDIMDEAIDKINDVYKRVWKRDMTFKELKTTFKFGMDNTEKEFREYLKNGE